MDTNTCLLFANRFDTEWKRLSIVLPGKVKTNITKCNMNNAVYPCRYHRLDWQRCQQ